MSKKICLILALFAQIFFSKGQSSEKIERCGANTSFSQSSDSLQFRAFVRKLKKQILQNHIAKLTKQTEEEVYQIPVIVHIVHNGEPIGEGNNLSAAQIYSQFDVLNEDFRRLNADTVNTPMVFQMVAADARIEFVPATIDPEGNVLAEQGIHRIESKFNTVQLQDSRLDIRPATIWNPSRYANVWVAETIRNTNGRSVAGSAEFPVNANIEGISEFAQQNNTTVDGVLVSNRFFGRFPDNPNVNDLNLGRTLTHEFGHWLGLLHVWGEGNGSCLIDDFCEDTPNVRTASFGCANTPSDTVACDGSLRMLQNYMEFTDDACMNIFTVNQVERMRAAIEIADRRKSLLTSDAARSKGVVAKFKVENTVICNGSSIQFSNTSQSIGGENITNLQWSFEGGTPSTSEETNPLVTFNEAGIFNAQLIAIGENFRDTISQTIQVINPEEVSSLENELSIDFEDNIFPPTNWTSTGAWQFSEVGLASNGGVKIENFYSNNTGQNSVLISPPINTSSVPAIEINFDYAYTWWQEADRFDSLAVLYRTDCNAEFQLLWQEGGENLATASASPNPLNPINRSVWDNQRLILELENPSSFVQIAFQGISNFSNNLFLDNILIGEFKGIIPNFAFETQRICINDSIQFENTSRNFSSDSLTFQWQFEGGTPRTSTEANPTITYQNEGRFRVQLRVSRTDGVSETLIKDELIVVSDPSNAEEKISEGFEQVSRLNQWDLSGWDVAEVGAFGESNRSIHAMYNFQSDTLVSPFLSLNQNKFVQINFDRAFAETLLDGSSTTLQIAYSTDCGRSFTVFWEKEGSDLATAHLQIEQFSPTAQQWESETIFLENIDAEFIQFAFISKESNLNLFLDNIEITPVQSVIPSFSSSVENLENFLNPTACVGQSVQFTDQSFILAENENIVSWAWEFEGGTPATSSEQNPIVTYNEGGTFDVKLTVTSQEGPQVELLNEDYLSAINFESNTDQIIETFQNPFSFRQSDWAIIAPNTWELISNIGGFGESIRSIAIDNFNQTFDRANLVSPILNLEDKSGLEIQFDYAYSKRPNLASDTLQLWAFSNCGNQQTLLWEGVGETLQTAPTTEERFFPLADQWAKAFIEIDDLNLEGNQENIQILFKNSSAGNNVIYLDNIEISAYEVVTPVADFTRNLLDRDSIFVQDTIQLIDLSTNRPRNWQWEITGPENFSFDVQNPSIIFNRAGVYTVKLTVSNLAGENAIEKIAFIEIFIDPVTGIDYNFLSKQISVYPNPAKSELNITSEGLQINRVKVFNTLGKLIFIREIKAQFAQIDINTTPKGFYILQIETNKGEVRKRFVRE